MSREMSVFVKGFVKAKKNGTERPAPDGVLRAYRAHQLSERLKERSRLRHEGLEKAREKV